MFERHKNIEMNFIIIHSEEFGFSCFTAQKKKTAVEGCRGVKNITFDWVKYVRLGLSINLSHCQSFLNNYLIYLQW
jgi:hypothetical protein